MTDRAKGQMKERIRARINDETTTDEMIDESRTVERDGAAAVRAELQLGAGELVIAGGAAALTTLLEADFSYNVPAWRPELTYTVSDNQGHLTIHQPSAPHERRTHNARQRWELRFATGVPLDLRIQVGAATASLIVGDLALNALTIQTGAGNLTLDLSGARQPFAVEIKGGVINATIALPGTIATEVAVHAPLAAVKAPGLHRAGQTYCNAVDVAPGEGARVAISGGVASIALAVGELPPRRGSKKA